MSEYRSEQRFEVGRLLIQNLIPTLPSASYAAVVLYCWVQGRAHKTAKSGSGHPLTVFQESADQIAKGTALSKRRARAIIADLERSGVFETEWIGRGVWPSRRIITHKKYAPQERGEIIDTRGEISCT